MTEVSYEQFKKLNIGTIDGPAHKKIAHLIGPTGSATALDILGLPPTKVSNREKLWAVLRPEFIDEATLYRFALECATEERKLHKIGSPASDADLMFIKSCLKTANFPHEEMDVAQQRAKQRRNYVSAALLDVNPQNSAYNTSLEAAWSAVCAVNGVKNICRTTRNKELAKSASSPWRKTWEKESQWQVDTLRDMLTREEKPTPSASEAEASKSAPSTPMYATLAQMSEMTEEVLSLDQFVKIISHNGLGCNILTYVDIENHIIEHMRRRRDGQICYRVAELAALVEQKGAADFKYWTLPLEAKKSPVPVHSKKELYELLNLSAALYGSVLYDCKTGDEVRPVFAEIKVKGEPVTVTVLGGKLISLEVKGKAVDTSTYAGFALLVRTVDAMEAQGYCCEKTGELFDKLKSDKKPASKK